MRIQTVLGLIMLLPALSLTACKKKKKDQPNQPADTLTTSFEARPATRLAPITLPETFATLLRPSYTKCTGKLKAHYQDAERSLPFTIHFRTERGVATTFTVTAALGVPVANGWIRPDSVYVDSKLGGQRIKEPLSRLTELTGLPPDLGVVESLLTGQYVLPTGFTPVSATDSGFTAMPLPNTDWRLNSTFNPTEGWPKELSLTDAQGQYVIRNSGTGSVPGPQKTTVVQSDRSGKVGSSIRLEAQQRKFE